MDSVVHARFGSNFVAYVWIWNKRHKNKQKITWMFSPLLLVIKYRICYKSIIELWVGMKIQRYAWMFSRLQEDLAQVLLALHITTHVKTHNKPGKSCNKSILKLLTSCVGTACSKSLERVWNKLWTTCNKLDGTIRLVARLFQQDWYSHDVTILSQPCVVDLVTILLQQVCIRVVRTTL